MYELPKLNYDFNALEPHIDAKTMEIHHGKHHQAYVNNLNAAVKDANIEGLELSELLANVSKYSPAIRNNGGGHYNHSLFWETIAPNAGGLPTGELMDAITTSFGSFDQFKEQFNKAATTRFGSGWAWLVVHEHTLVVSSTPNQDNPLMDLADIKGTPILGLDVWEHAYYLNYQNRRPDYIAAFWNVVNWNKVSELYSKAK